MTVSNSAKIIHPYIKKRIQQLQKYLYPRNHLWGIDIFNLSKKTQKTQIKYGQILRVQRAVQVEQAAHGGRLE